MKTDSLNNKLYYNILLIILLGYSNLNAQTSKGNITLIIDNKIVTNNLQIVFINEDLVNEQTFNYHLGKELNLPNELFKNNKLNIKFKYLGKFRGQAKTYEYLFNFKKGWLHNTDYLIIRIYNLDKKKFKKSFCDQKLPYAIEIQNAVYNENQILCRELKDRV